jgi:hypothetical protein
LSENFHEIAVRQIDMKLMCVLDYDLPAIREIESVAIDGYPPDKCPDE